MTGAPRAKVRTLAHEALDAGDALAWFDEVYEQAAGETGAVPWADLEPNPALVAWLAKTAFDVRDRPALVIGCGLGDDAEHLASRGARVTAFDLSPRAIAWCKERFPATRVTYEAADLLAPPVSWSGAFDLVFEAYTVQSLPPASAERRRALEVLAPLVAPGGALLVVARFAEQLPTRADGPPWPLVREEVERAGAGLSLEGWDDFDDAGTRRVRASWRRVVA